MRSLAHQHWLYVWIPLVGATVWFGTLLAMLIVYLAEGRPHYVSEDGSIAYISDVGADILKPLFVTGCSITAVSFFLALFVERWLRHSGRLVPDMRRRERVFSILAILGSFIGGCGLILLSIFDTKRHPSLHRVFLLVFIVGVGLSAIFTIIEYRWLSHDYMELKNLKLAYVIKGTIAAILIVLAIAFAITLYTANDVGAVLEWIIAFGYTLYLLSFFYDLRMAKGVERGALSKARLMDMQQQGIPVSAVTQGHEGDFDPYNGNGFGTQTHTHPNGYSHQGLGHQNASAMPVPGRDGYAHSVRTNDTYGTLSGAPMQAGSNPVTVPHPTYYGGNDRAANAY